MDSLQVYALGTLGIYLPDVMDWLLELVSYSCSLD